jgi:hypothetical protein
MWDQIVNGPKRENGDPNDLTGMGAINSDRGGNGSANDAKLQLPHGVLADLIASHEGNQRLDAYVVGKGKGWKFRHTGVTVATGVDLGQQSADKFRRLGFSEEEIALLQPYMRQNGKKLQGVAAQAFLDDHPLIISPNLADKLDRVIQYDAVNQVAHEYDAAQPAVNFDTLSPEVRTALADAAYQLGMQGVKDLYGGRYWHAAVNGDWRALSGMLAAEPKAGYPDRRHAEARWINKSLEHTRTK